jgi:hypothetical protein
MMSESKQIGSLSLKSLMIASLPLEKTVLQSPSWHTHQLLNHSKRTENDKDRGLELKRGSKRFFLFKIEANYHLSLFQCLLHCSFTSDAQRTFLTLQFAHPLKQKLLNSANE